MKGDRIRDPYDQQQHDDGYDVHVQHVHDDARQKVSAHRQHTRLIFRISNRGAVWAPRFFFFWLASLNSTRRLADIFCRSFVRKA